MTSIMSHSLPFIPLPLSLGFNLSRASNMLLQATEINKVPSPSSPQHPAFHHSRPANDSFDENVSVPSVESSSRRTDKNTNDDDDDRMSCSSEDSELSVGKEDESSPKSGAEQRRFASAESDKFSEENSCDSNRPFSQTLFRPSPSRLQEEFLRKSQLYAEELMRQQIAAATRTGGLMSRLENVVSSRRMTPDEPPRMTYRPHLSNLESMDQRFNVKSPDLSFRNIHSHLNAISQITQNLSGDLQKIPSPSIGSMTSRESSQSPIATYHHNNNNSNEPNIKFSIDNILKADFGHRIGITDPIRRTKTAARKNGNGRRHATAMDLTAVQDKAAADTSNVETNTTPAAPTATTTTSTSATTSATKETKGDPVVWPAWVYCTRYSDRPSSGPRVKRPKKPPGEKNASPSSNSSQVPDDKRPRTAFSGPQLARLKHEFNENRYLAEKRRQQLSAELGLNEAQIKIWFQNKRAKIKKSTGQKNPLALQLMAQGLYNHSTIPLTREEEEMQELQAAG